MRFFQLVSRLLLPLVAVTTAQAQLIPSAVRVLGQPDLRQNGQNSVVGSELFNPSGVAIDANAVPPRLYVADTANHRILAWQDATAFENGAPANLVLGQSSFRHTIPLGIGVRGLNQPVGLAVHPQTGDLYVADSGNHRVLRFANPFDNPARVEAAGVIGQPDFSTRTANSGGLSARSLRSPIGVAFDREGSLWVADTGNHRLLRFPASVLEEAYPLADIALGQANFGSGSTNGGQGSRNGQGFNGPVSLAFHPDGSLYVADGGNARVLIFSAPFENNETAARVLGQADFQAFSLTPQTSPVTMRGPNGLAIDRQGTLYVAIATEHRVIAYENVAAAAALEEADRVLGQPVLTISQPNVDSFPRASAEGLLSPAAVAVTPTGTLFVADAGNSRVLSYDDGRGAADRVLGQADFVRNGANQLDADSIGGVFDIAVDYSQEGFPLYVADTTNHRVLGWRSSLRFRNGQPADLVIGQADFTSGFANADTGRGQSPTATSLANPRGLALNSRGDLYLADAGNNRVLRFPRPFEQQGRARADLVLGQRDFLSSISAAVSATSLSAPSGISVAPDGRLYVADTVNHRVLEYPSEPANGAAAVRVFGQPNFTSGAPPATVSAQTLAQPESVHADEFGLLYVTDGGANRVLIFPISEDLPASGVSASTVIGQGSFTSAGSGRNATSLNLPRQVATDAEGRIYVTDSNNHRILRYPSALFVPIAGGAAEMVFGQPDFSAGNPNFNTPDGLATAQALFAPVGLFVDRNATIYVGDSGNNRVVHFLRPTATVSAATFVSGVGVSPGSLVSMFGEELSAETGQAGSLPLPDTLAARRVEINDEIRAPLLYVSPGQFNFQLPAETPTGLQRVVLRRADTDEPLAGGEIVVSPAIPGLFTASQSGSGQAVAVNEGGGLNEAGNPANVGSVVTFYGTGQGPTDPTVPSGQAAPQEPLARTTAQPRNNARDCVTAQPAVCVVVGSQFGEVLYSGLAPGFVGLWQLNVRLPSGDTALTGSNVPVQVLLNRRPSNTVTIAIQ